MRHYLEEDGPQLLKMIYLEMVRRHWDYLFNHVHSVPHSCSNVCEVVTKYLTYWHCKLKKFE